jgi:protein TonB
MSSGLPRAALGASLAVHGFALAFLPGFAGAPIAPPRPADPLRVVLAPERDTAAATRATAPERPVAMPRASAPPPRPTAQAAAQPPPTARSASTAEPDLRVAAVVPNPPSEAPRTLAAEALPASPGAGEVAAVPAPGASPAAPRPALAPPAPDAGAERVETARPDHLHNPPPEYPALARRYGLTGRVLVRAYVEPGGTAREVVLAASSGHEVLDEAALRSVRTWRFVPARRGQVQLATWVEFPVRFELAR